MNKKTRYLLIFIVAAFVLSPIIATAGYWEFDYTTTQTKTIPVIYCRLYDPAGTNSYQELTETSSSSVSLKFESEAAGNGVSSTATVSQSASVGVRTVDTNTNPSENGIGKGDVIIGSIIKYTLKLYCTGIQTSWGYSVRINNVVLQSIDWDYSDFALHPADFKTQFGKDAPSKIGTSGTYQKNIMVSRGVAVTYTNTLKITSTQSMSFGFEFSYAGIKIKSKATTTFSAGYEIKSKVYLKDTTQVITHSMHYSGSGSTSGTNILANSMIPWFSYTSGFII